MLKITQIDSETLQLYVGYVKTFLIIALIVFICIALIVFFSYEHIRVEANRGKNNLRVQTFSFMKKSQNQEFTLSEVENMSSGINTRKNGRYRNSYENPVLIFQNGNSLKLLRKSRNVLYSSNLARKFNQFLKHSNENTFSKKVMYLGNLTSIILGILILVFVALSVVALLVGNVKMTFDKESSSYKVAYTSPIYSHKKGSLKDIKAVLLLHRVAESFEQKQAGIYLLLENKSTIMIQALGSVNRKDVERNTLPALEKAQKIANFLGIELKEEN